MWNYNNWSKFRPLGHNHVSLLSSMATTRKEIPSSPKWKRHPREQTAVLHSVIELYAMGVDNTSKKNWGDSSLWIENIKSGGRWSQKIQTLGGLQCHIKQLPLEIFRRNFKKCCRSSNYIIFRRGRKNRKFSYIESAEDKRPILTCLEFTLLMQKVQKNLN